MNFPSVFSFCDNLTVASGVTRISPSFFQPTKFVSVLTTNHAVFPGFGVIVRVFHTSTKLNEKGCAANCHDRHFVFTPVLNGTGNIVRAIVDRFTELRRCNLNTFISRAFRNSFVLSINHCL